MQVTLLLVKCLFSEINWLVSWQNILAGKICIKIFVSVSETMIIKTAYRHHTFTPVFSYKCRIECHWRKIPSIWKQPSFLCECIFSAVPNTCITDWKCILFQLPQIKTTPKAELFNISSREGKHSMQLQLHRIMLNTNFRLSAVLKIFAVSICN